MRGGSREVSTPPVFQVGVRRFYFQQASMNKRQRKKQRLIAQRAVTPRQRDYHKLLIGTSQAAQRRQQSFRRNVQGRIINRLRNISVEALAQKYPTEFQAELSYQQTKIDAEEQKRVQTLTWFCILQDARVLLTADGLRISKVSRTVVEGTTDHGPPTKLSWFHNDGRWLVIRNVNGVARIVFALETLRKLQLVSETPHLPTSIARLMVQFLCRDPGL